MRNGKIELKGIEKLKDMFDIFLSLVIRLAGLVLVRAPVTI
jgi:hypothetical protein